MDQPGTLVWMKNLETVVRAYGVLPASSNAHSYPQRPSAVNPDGTFWVGPPAGDASVGYYLEKWDTGGRMLSAIIRDVPWFQRREIPEGVAGLPLKAPSLIRVNVDSAGLIWVMLQVPGPNWKGGIVPRPLTREAISKTIREEVEMRLEVINPATLTVMASLASPRTATTTIGLLPHSRSGWRFTDDSLSRPGLEIFAYDLKDKNGNACSAK